MEAKSIQTQIRLNFNNSDLLQQALTHRSYINEHGDDSASDNERLEFLGDAVLDFLVGDMLYQRFPDMPEGDLTRLRAALVRTESLAELALNLGLGQALRMGKGEETSGGRERLTNLCASFESVVGALYLDQSLDAVRKFAIPLLDSLLEQILADSRDKDARSRLQEWSQATHNLTPAYRTLSATGPDHQKEFVVEVVIGERGVAHGTGRSKQAAAQDAAREALHLLEKGDLVV
ncbi:MAG: ribonuclease III [Chloroflexota bacterium]